MTTEAGRRCRRSARAAGGSTRRCAPTPARRARRSPARSTADVCVVGGGFAGLWTAYELHERDPGLDIVLLEADIVGAGGSGANGGFFSPSWTQLSSLCASLGRGGRGGLRRRPRRHGRRARRLDRAARRAHRRPPRGHPVRPGRGVAARARRRDVPAAREARLRRPAAARGRRRGAGASPTRRASSAAWSRRTSRCSSRASSRASCAACCSSAACASSRARRWCAWRPAGRARSSRRPVP